MGLSLESEAYVGRLLVVEPGYGYGWNSQVEVAGTYPEVEVPKPFHIKVERFFCVSGELRGAIGTIIEPGHALGSLLLAFNTRHVGEWNLRNNPPACNLTVGISAHETDKGYLLAVGPPALVGFGTVRDDAV